MVNKSREIKNPKTPEHRRIRLMKNSLERNSISHEANTPAKMTTAVSAIIATDIPSTPMAYRMFRLGNQVLSAVKSISSVTPAFLALRYMNTSVPARIS